MSSFSSVQEIKIYSFFDLQGEPSTSVKEPDVEKIKYCVEGDSITIPVEDPRFPIKGMYCVGKINDAMKASLLRRLKKELPSLQKTISSSLRTFRGNAEDMYPITALDLLQWYMMQILHVHQLFFPEDHSREKAWQTVLASFAKKEQEAVALSQGETWAQFKEEILGLIEELHKDVGATPEVAHLEIVFNDIKILLENINNSIVPRTSLCLLNKVNKKYLCEVSDEPYFFVPIQGSSVLRGSQILAEQLRFNLLWILQRYENLLEGVDEKVFQPFVDCGILHKTPHEILQEWQGNKTKWIQALDGLPRGIKEESFLEEYALIEEIERFIQIHFYYPNELEEKARAVFAFIKERKQDPFSVEICPPKEGPSCYFKSATTNILELSEVQCQTVLHLVKGLWEVAHCMDTYCAGRVKRLVFLLHALRAARLAAIHWHGEEKGKKSFVQTLQKWSECPTHFRWVVDQEGAFLDASSTSKGKEKKFADESLAADTVRMFSLQQYLTKQTGKLTKQTGKFPALHNTQWHARLLHDLSIELHEESLSFRENPMQVSFAFLGHITWALEQWLKYTAQKKKHLSPKMRTSHNLCTLYRCAFPSARNIPPLILECNTLRFWMRYPLEEFERWARLHRDTSYPIPPSLKALSDLLSGKVNQDLLLRWVSRLRGDFLSFMESHCRVSPLEEEEKAREKRSFSWKKQGIEEGKKLVEALRKKKRKMPEEQRKVAMEAQFHLTLACKALEKLHSVEKISLLRLWTVDTFLHMHLALELYLRSLFIAQGRDVPKTHSLLKLTEQLEMTDIDKEFLARWEGVQQKMRYPFDKEGKSGVCACIDQLEVLVQGDGTGIQEWISEMESHVEIALMCFHRFLEFDFRG